MAQDVFPAVCRWDNEERYYDVTFPDLENCFTAGYDQSEALENASDALNFMLCDREDCEQDMPTPTPLEQLNPPAGGFVNLIAADTDAYRAVIEHENNPIKYARQKAGLNIKKLADLLGAPYRTVQEWNAGRRMPPEWVQRLIIEKIEANT